MTTRNAGAIVVIAVVPATVLVGFAQSVGQPSAPFFSDDQTGLLRIILVIVVPIIGGIGAWVWKLSHTKEKQDMDALGAKIGALSERLGASDMRMSALDVRIAEDRLANQAALFEAQRGILEQVSSIRLALARIEGVRVTPKDEGAGR